MLVVLRLRKDDSLASRSTSPWASLQNINATTPAGRRKLSSTSLDAIYCKRISSHAAHQAAGLGYTPPVNRALLVRKTESDPCVNVGGRISGSEPCLPGAAEPVLTKFIRLDGSIGREQISAEGNQSSVHR